MRARFNYQARPISTIGRWEIGGYRLKIYGIAHDRPQPSEALVAAAQVTIERYLRQPTRQEAYGVGFVGIHDGRTENQIFLDRWVNENELLHKVWVSHKDRPMQILEPREDHNSVCVWDLKVQCAEREAWIKHVIGNAQGYDFDAYLEDTFEGLF